MNIVQKILMYLGAVAFIGAASIGVYHFAFEGKKDPTYSFEPGQLT